MKILTVSSSNWGGGLSIFVEEQIESIKKHGIEIDSFLIKGKGVRGYLSNYSKLVQTIKDNDYDLIHAHFGLSGCLSVLQRTLPVITTFHGGDVDLLRNKPFSILAMLLSSHSIFVNKNDMKRYETFVKRKSSVIPCGVDLNQTFPLNSISNLREKYNFPKEEKIIIFSSSFDRDVKNVSLAKEALKSLNSNIILKELNGYSREEVNELLNVGDLLLLTSKREASPMVIKEAMACNCPIVTTNVGDAKEVIGNTEGCYITSFEPDDVAQKIQKALDFGTRTNGRNNISKVEINDIAKQVIEVYESVLKKKKRS